MKFAVLGDLHFEEQEDQIFADARGHILSQGPDAIVSLGDLGGYTHCGTQQSFDEGKAYFDSYQIPAYALIGNHDLEAIEEFDTDEKAINAFCKTFQLERPYHAFRLGEAIGVCLSSTQFRRNKGCYHEVYIDDEQYAWFETLLKENPDTPTIVFSHCPPLGSGIRVMQNLHLTFGNAWLNHTTGPQRFIELVNRHSQIRMWFSGHYHLGHNYENSIALVNSCLFVNTSVISNVSRDGFRQSRLVEIEGPQLTLSTIDHDLRQTIVDAVYDLEAGHIERQNTALKAPETAMIPAPDYSEIPHDLCIGKSVFFPHHDTLLEYDSELKAPVGVITRQISGRQIALEDKAIVLKGRWGFGERIEPNADGYYFRPQM